MPEWDPDYYGLGRFIYGIPIIFLILLSSLWIVSAVFIFISPLPLLISACSILSDSFVSLNITSIIHRVRISNSVQALSA